MTEPDPAVLTQRLVRAGHLDALLETAVRVAREGERERPPCPAPAALRPILGFRRLPPAARDTVAQCLAADASFRARVAAGTNEARLGRAACLWLEQPEGWLDVLAAYVDDESAPDRDEADARVLQRKLSGAERAVRRARDEGRSRDADLARLKAELGEVRDELRSVKRERDHARRELAAAQAELARASDAREASAARLARREAERRGLRHRIRELEAEASTTGADPVRAERRARAVVSALQAALREAETVANDLAAAPSGSGAGRDPRTVPRRRPVPLPGGVVDDSIAAASFLLGLDRLVLLVDGYNATLTTWPELRLDQGRHRLVALLEDLVQRHATLDCTVVFDGADVAAIARRGRASRVVVRFTEEDVEADDVVIELAAATPLSRPVVVASDDREVRRRAADVGANVVSVQQLLTVIR